MNNSDTSSTTSSTPSSKPLKVGQVIRSLGEDDHEPLPAPKPPLKLTTWDKYKWNLLIVFCVMAVFGCALFLMNVIASDESHTYRVGIPDGTAMKFSNSSLAALYSNNTDPIYIEISKSKLDGSITGIKPTNTTGNHTIFFNMDGYDVQQEPTSNSKNTFKVDFREMRVLGNLTLNGDSTSLVLLTNGSNCSNLADCLPYECCLLDPILLKFEKLD